MIYVRKETEGRINVVVGLSDADIVPSLCA